VKVLSELWLAIREDAQFAYRSLARVPTYTATVVLTLALAIGGITAVFSVLYAVVLRPLPFPEAQQIVTVHTHYQRFGSQHLPSSPTEFLDILNRTQSFSKVAALTTGSVNLTRHGESLRVGGHRASAEFIRLFGVPPVLGRDFAPGEDAEGAPLVVLLSSRFHRRVFNGAVDAVGQVVDIDGQPHTIIGVLPPVYDHYPRLGDPTGQVPNSELRSEDEPGDVWLPLTFNQRQLDPRSRGERFLQVFGRLKPGVTLASASADIERLTEAFYRDFPASYRRESGFRLFLESAQDYAAGKLGRVLSLMFGAVALVLLAACANVVSITLARLAARRREIAVRVALGATAGRIMLQFFVESLSVACVSGVLGLVIGRVGMDGLLALGSEPLERIEVSFQLPVLAFALAVSLVTGIVAGAAPAWHAARLAPIRGLQEGGRSTSGGAMRLRSGLAIAQVTVALVLLAGTTMVLRSLLELTATSPGFEPKQVYVGNVALAEPRYADDVDRRRFADRVLERLRAIPGVDSAGLSNLLPFADQSNYTFHVEGEPAQAAGNAELRMVAGDYAETLGLKLRAGRFLGAGDTRDASKVAVISELTAKKYFNGRNPLGMQICYRMNTLDTEFPFTIVGIFGDARERGMEEPIEPLVFVPFDQWPQTSLGFAVRAPALGASALPAMRAAVAAVDPTQPVYRAVPLQRLVDLSLGSRRFALLLLSVFAALALALAVLGIYGITAYSVVQRTPELAVRMAMGADDRAVIRLVLARALRLVVLGLVLGVVLVAIGGQYLASVIYGLSPWEPGVVGFIALVMILGTVVAAWIPARRAAALSLVSALRAE
jgi:putative ABC transport system permease protein